MDRARTLLAGFFLLGLASAGAWEFTDPAGDDTGPGGYRYPDHPLFSRGTLDLRRVVLQREGERWRVEVEFAAAISRGEIAVGRDERRRIFPHLVDLYFQLPDAGPERSEALAGRRLRLRPGWQRAAVLCALADRMADALYRSGYDRDTVYVARDVKVSGRKLRAWIPHAWLEDEPRAVAVVVGAVFPDVSFRLRDRLQDRWQSSGLTMDVEAAAGECRLDDAGGMRCHFSGCRPCGLHPRVLEVLDPAGGQQAWLSGYGPGREAEIEMVSLVPEGGMREPWPK